MVVHRSLVLWLALLLGLALTGAGLALLVRGRPAPQVGVVPAVTAGASTLAPLVEPAVPGVEPTRLTLDTLGIDSPVLPVDVQADGQLAVPDDPHVLGWWAGGARPGSARGTVVIDGHVDTARDGPGALFHLARLTSGAKVVLSGPGGSVTYVVAAMRHYPKAALPAEAFDRAGASRLVLITCGGTFNRHTRQYADNIVAYAVPDRT